MTDLATDESPTLEALVDDIKLVRRRGITKLRKLDLPALRAAALASGRVQTEIGAGPAEIETLLRDALGDFESGRFGDAPSVLFGLMPGTRGYEPDDLRTQAASLLDVSRSWFRNHHEHVIVDEMALTIRRMCHEHQLRLSALNMERRLPTSSRLAVAWMDRFEAYYAMWTPIYAIAASVTAYRAMLLDEDRPYDRPPSEREPDGYTQELQAAGYGSQGLFYLAEYLVELGRFRTRFGGLWILSSKVADSDIADSSYLVHYRAPFSDREESLLRMRYAESEGQLHIFRGFEDSDPSFAAVHAKWHRFLATCECSWPINEPPERGHFHTHKTVPTISEDCQPHQMISAANDYCVVIDYEWDLLADWYHIGDERQVGVDGLVLYHQLREATERSGVNVWPPWGS